MTTARHARHILDLVANGDLMSLETALQEASAACALSRERSSADAESMELLGGVVEEISGVLDRLERQQERQMAELEAPLGLLQHLVESGRGEQVWRLQ
ncbi:MAG: hypothetical protein HY013_11710 [Candidatus Solibacter usitatus]|nr:hypothetical protein [Candidatus Solibacter usitatus]